MSHEEELGRLQAQVETLQRERKEDRHRQEEFSKDMRATRDSVLRLEGKMDTAIALAPRVQELEFALRPLVGLEARMDERVKPLEAARLQVVGGWKVILGASTVAGGVAAFLSKLFGG